MAACGARGRRVLTLQGHGGAHERLVHLECTEEEHEGDEHYDSTYGLEFLASHQVVDS